MWFKICITGSHCPRPTCSWSRISVLLAPLPTLRRDRGQPAICPLTRPVSGLQVELMDSWFKYQCPPLLYFHSFGRKWSSSGLGFCFRPVQLTSLVRVSKLLFETLVSIQFHKMILNTYNIQSSRKAWEMRMTQNLHYRKYTTSMELVLKHNRYSEGCFHRGAKITRWMQRIVEFRDGHPNWQEEMVIRPEGRRAF